MNGGMKSGNAACDTLTQALAPIVALVDELVSRVDKLERDLSAARLRNDRMRAELLAMEQALGGAQTLISAGPAKTPWTCYLCGTQVYDIARACHICGNWHVHMLERGAPR